MNEKNQYLLPLGGFIPQNQECPFAFECEQRKANQCFHSGVYHNVPFLCSIAKLYDLGRMKR